MPKAKTPSGSPTSVKSGGLDVELLREVVDILEASEITRLIWRNGEQKLIIRRGPHPSPVVHAQLPSSSPSVHVMAPMPPPANHSEPPKPRASAPKPSNEASAEPKGQASTEKKGQVFTSPFVGTFYRSPAPDQPAYVEVGSTVRKGQVVCIIEAMKLMNEIECEFDGKVAEILVKNAQSVEFGQPLFRIEQG